ncbi:MAG: flavin reductase [Oscillospiraceae bacterium]|jgi:flavin reductase (DIM6/NTAB) family NADH-FMN oxidoreductase RutF|nr:flavin reductase [Oscillospiraceae bacterium]
MKKEFSAKPDCITELWPGELTNGAWQDVIAGIPLPIFLMTGWKSNGRENACLQSWSAFAGSDGAFLCLIGSMFPGGHAYQSLKETGCAVLNFPSRDIYALCKKTIENNQWETDEITASGLTAEPAVSVNAPRIAECFLNLECTFLWEHPLLDETGDMTVALRCTHLCMDSRHYDERRLGRRGEDGYLYNIAAPRNPETGEAEAFLTGTLTKAAGEEM